MMTLEQTLTELRARRGELAEVADYLAQYPTNYPAIIRRNELTNIVEKLQQQADTLTQQLNRP